MIAADVTLLCQGCKRAAQRTCLLAVPLNVRCRGCGEFMLVVHFSSRNATKDELTIAESLVPPVAVVGTPPDDWTPRIPSAEIPGKLYSTECEAWGSLGIDIEDKKEQT